MTEKKDESVDISVESKLKKAMGNVLATSGGWNNSLISNDPFKYSQLGTFTANLLNDALMKSRLDVQNVISGSLKREIEDQQRKLIEQAKESVSQQVNIAIEEIARDRAKVVEELSRDRAKVVEELSRDRAKQQSELQKMAFDPSVLNRKIYKEIEDQQRKLIEQASQSINKKLQDKIKKNVILKGD